MLNPAVFIIFYLIFVICFCKDILLYCFDPFAVFWSQFTIFNCVIYLFVFLFFYFFIDFVCFAHQSCNYIYIYIINSQIITIGILMIFWLLSCEMTPKKTIFKTLWMDFFFLEMSCEIINAVLQLCFLKNTTFIFSIVKRMAVDSMMFVFVSVFALLESWARVERWRVVCVATTDVSDRRPITGDSDELV